MPSDPLHLSPRPSRRLAALATLAFAGTLGGGGTSAAAAPASAKRVGPSPQRAAARPVNAAPAASPIGLPSAAELEPFAEALGVHPERLAAALRKLTPDASRSVGGLDPLTALARELRLPATTVYLAAARAAARHPNA